MSDNAFASDDEDGTPQRPSAMQEAITSAVAVSEKNTTMLELMRDLTYPESKDGSTLDISFFSTIIAWHLVRCGWRIDESKREIKPRRLIAKGLAPDAVEWVDINEPDELDYASMTMAEIRSLEPRQRAIAMRALGGPETPDLPPNPGWHVQTNIQIQDEPDVNDGNYWTGRQYTK
jgi:hypothetical protein